MNKQPDKKLSVLLLGTQMATGGAQRVLLDQANWFHANGYSVTVAFFYDKQGLHQQWQKVSPFVIHNLHSRESGASHFSNIIDLAKGMLHLWKLLQSGHFDVIETFTQDSNLLGLPVAWLCKVPIRIATIHGRIDGDTKLRRRFHAWLMNSNIASMVIAVSNGTQATAIQEGIKPHKIEVIPNGIALQESDKVRQPQYRETIGIPQQHIFLLAVGRLIQQKAHDTLVQAMAIVCRHNPKIVLGIAGDGPLLETLNNQIVDLGMQENVRLLGNRDDVPELLASADIFVMSSRSEGLPIALLEAMGAGLPVICTQIESIEDVIENGRHGILVPIDNAEALALAIERLSGDPNTRLRLSREAKQRVLDSYTLDRMCNRYLEIMTPLRSSDQRSSRKGSS
jgi:glycosyltransferase involved in cell wall biosynthesis